MYWIKTPRIVQWLYPERVWRIPNQEKNIFLTFDDGPCPQITSWVLQQLQKYDAFATFFCVGQNIEREPVIYKKIIREGHSIGNHTYSHKNGWQTPFEQYQEEIEACARLTDTQLFRPPYGKMTRSQARWARAQGFRLIYWDVLVGDFDMDLSGEQCLKNAITSASQGSIIVLHDSVKAWERLHFVLPRLLEYFSEKGYKFQKIV